MKKPLPLSSRAQRGTCFLTLGFLLQFLFLSGCGTVGERPGPRVVVLGFDGADPGLARKWMDEGRLPHLAELARQGTFTTLGTTNPPESPVAWASFATGNNPGRHGIFDFLKRDPANYLPEIALVEARRAKFLWGIIPVRLPKVTNLRHGVPFYEAASLAGVRTAALRMPLEFPPSTMGLGQLLGGLSVPDLRGTWGTFFYFATDLSQWDVGNTEFGGRLVRLELKDGTAEVKLDGPPDPTAPRFTRAEIPLRFAVRTSAVEISLGRRREMVPEGRWSNWFHVTYAVAPFIRLHGICRFYVLEVTPELRVYMAPINMDPERPPVPLSFPADFSRKLAERYGPYKTLGWLDDTWALNEQRIDEGLFLEDTFDTMDRQAAMVLDQVKDRRVRLVTTVFSATDTVSHMFFRLLDPEHPAYDPELAARYGDAILRAYQRMDSIVGRAMAALKDEPDATLLVVSDHGFHSWRKEFNTNTWLAQNGFLALKGAGPGQGIKKLDDLFGQGSFFTDVDWSRTKAYALGLGQIYLNLKGREKHGMVNPGTEAEQVLRQIEQGLRNYRDPETGEAVLEGVYRREAIFRGPLVPEAAELQLTFRGPYRTSWQSTLGGLPAGVISANLKKWSGDHCSSDPRDTGGIFFSNRHLPATANPHITDIAPSVLRLLGVSKAPEMDGRPLRLQP